MDKIIIKNCDVEIMLKGGGRMKGEYLFTIDACHGDPKHSPIQAFVKCPSEHKQHNFGRLINGQYSTTQTIECFGTSNRYFLRIEKTDFPSKHT